MAQSAQPVPPMWKSGMATSETMSGPTSKIWLAASRMQAKLRADSTAPLGKPVVPEV